MKRITLSAETINENGEARIGIKRENVTNKDEFFFLAALFANFIEENDIGAFSLAAVLLDTYMGMEHSVTKGDDDHEG